MNFVLDIHSHTIASGHAYSTLLEYVNAAKETGLSLIAITDHAPKMPGSAGEMHFLNFKVIPNEIDGVRVMMGAELNILDKDGAVDLKPSIIRKLCPVIASFHTPTYEFENCDMTDDEKKAEITQALVNVMKNEDIDIIGHLGDPRYPFDIEEAVKTSIETKTLIEINNASLNPNSFRFGSKEPMIDMLKCCKKYNCPIVAGTDAHFALDAGKFTETIQLLQEVEFPRHLVANTNAAYFFELLKGDTHE